MLPGELNVGEAYSRGLELEMDALLTSHLTAHLGYTYDATKLTRLSPLYVFPNVAGAAPMVGSALPGTPRSSAAVTLEYGRVPFVGGDLSAGRIHRHGRSGRGLSFKAVATTLRFVSCAS